MGAITGRTVGYPAQYLFEGRSFSPVVTKVQDNRSEWALPRVAGAGPHHAGSGMIHSCPQHALELSGGAHVPSCLYRPWKAYNMHPEPSSTETSSSVGMFNDTSVLTVKCSFS